MVFCTVKEAVRELAEGRFLIIVDEGSRDNPGDLAVAAEKITPEKLNFMAAEARGMRYVAMPKARVEALQIPLQPATDSQRDAAPLCVAVDAGHGLRTGASVQEQTETIRLLASEEAAAGDFVRPGHVLPRQAAPGGVLRRAGHTEAAVDLARMAGLQPAAVICQVMRADGQLATLPDLEMFASRHGIRIVTITSLIEHRRRTEKLVRRESEAYLPTEFGDWKMVAYRSEVDGAPYLALVKGDVAGVEEVLVRMHSACLTGDVFHSQRCDCGEQLRQAMQMIQQEGVGVVVYIPLHEGRGIGLHNKVRAYELQDAGADTVEANEILGFPPDKRDYGIGAQVLADLGLTTMRLLTNNPKKVVGLDGHGLSITAMVPIEVPATPYSQRYLSTKREKLGHVLRLEDVQ